MADPFDMFAPAILNAPQRTRGVKRLQRLVEALSMCRSVEELRMVALDRHASRTPKAIAATLGVDVAAVYRTLGDFNRHESETRRAVCRQNSRRAL